MSMLISSVVGQGGVTRMHIGMHIQADGNASAVGRLDVTDAMLIFRMIIGIIFLGSMYKMYIVGLLGNTT